MTTMSIKQRQVQDVLRMILPGGRLTLESGVPVSSTDQTSKTTIYYTPYVHNGISLWDGSIWNTVTFAETTQALGTLTNAKPYDVFGYLSSGALATEMLVWTNDTTRATAVTLQDGRYCKSGDKTRLYLGSFYTTSTTTTADAQVNRLVWNMYNRVSKDLMGSESTSHTINNTAAREWNNASAGRANYIAGMAEDSVTQTIMVMASPIGINSYPIFFTARDTTPGLRWRFHQAQGVNTADMENCTTSIFPPLLGFHYMTVREQEALNVATTASAHQHFTSIRC